MIPFALAALAVFNVGLFIGFMLGGYTEQMKSHHLSHHASGAHNDPAPVTDARP